MQLEVDAALFGAVERQQALKLRTVAATLLDKRALRQHAHGLAAAADELGQGEAYSVIFIDLDHLKLVNDTYGHLVGDEYIRMAATVFKSALPDTAHTFRIGGDEFVAFLPHTTKEEADAFVEEMKRQCQLFWVRENHVSISFGTAVIESPQTGAYNAIANADRAMYTNKIASKNARTS